MTTSNIVRVSKVTKTFRMGKVDVQALKGVDLAGGRRQVYLHHGAFRLRAKARFST